MNDEIPTSLTYQQQRAASRIRPISLSLAILLILSARFLLGISAYVEFAALSGVIVAVYIARSWWVSRMPWTGPGLSQALFALLMIVALLPGSALQMPGFAESGQGDNRSIRDAAPAPSAPESRSNPAPAREALVQPITAPVESQSIRAAQQPVAVAEAAQAVVPTAIIAPIAPALSVETIVPVTPITTRENVAELEQTPVIVPGAALTALGHCNGDGSYDVQLTIVTFGAPAVVTDVLVVPTPGAAAMPWAPQIPLPTTIAPGVANWKWTIDPATTAGETLKPTAVFVRVANMPGDPAARAALGSEVDGWISTALPALSRPCEDSTTPDVADPPSQRAALDLRTSEPKVSERAVRHRQEPESEASSRSARGREATKGRSRSARGDETANALDRMAASSATVQAALDPAASEPATPQPLDSETAIRVTLLSPDEEAAPGDSVSYIFRVLNDSGETQTVRLSAINSVEGWSAIVSAVDAALPLAAPVELAAGQFMDVVVIVRVPEGARATTSNDTTLRAYIVGENALGSTTGNSNETSLPPNAAKTDRSIRP